MDKLISADRFIKEITDLADNAKFDYHDLHYSTNDVISNIECQKKVDAIPVKWIFEKFKRMRLSEREVIVKLINEFNEECKKG